MSDLVERVSRAIAPEWWSGLDAADESTKNWLINVQAHVFNMRRAKDVILAILEAIREPTTKQLAAVVSSDEYSPFTDCAMRSVYQDMIDAKRAEIEEE